MEAQNIQIKPEHKPFQLNSKLAGNVVSRNPNPGSKEGLFLKRVRPDLPEPSKLHSKSKKSNKRRPPSHTAWNISEHIAQLKHKCQDFNL